MVWNKIRVYKIRIQAKSYYKVCKKARVLKEKQNCQKDLLNN